MRITLTDREGASRQIDMPAGISLMEAIRLSGSDEILALCGGSCSCATCHVHVAPGYEDQLTPMSEDEAILLETSDHRTARSRLSCQILVEPALDGLHVTIAPED